MKVGMEIDGWDVRIKRDVWVKENLSDNYWRKFGSQTSDNMDKWKSRGGKSQRREDKKREDQRRERARGKKMQVKVEKIQFMAFFKMVCGSGGSKSRLAKAVGAEPFGQMRDEQLHAVLARSRFWSQNASVLEHSWKRTCLKSSRCYCARIWK